MTTTECTGCHFTAVNGVAVIDSAHQCRTPAAPPRCPWCRTPDSDYEPMDPERELCRAHLAEHEGLSLDGLDRMEREQAADRL